MGFVIMRTTIAALGLAAAASGLQAQSDWGAVVIGQPGNGADTAFADAFHVTASLSRGGQRIVPMLRDTTREEVIATLRAVSPGKGIIIYIAGPATTEGALALRNSTLTLTEMTEELANSGVGQIAFLLETCAHQSTAAASYALPETAPDTAIWVAATATGQVPCPPSGSRLTDRIQRAASTATLQQILAGLVVVDDGFPEMRLTEPAAAHSGPVIAVGPIGGGLDDVITITSVAPTRTNSVSATNVQPRTSGTGAAQPSDIVLAAAPVGAGVGILPRAPGMPEPSVLIGFPDPAALPEFDNAQEAPPAVVSELTLTDPEVRIALRADNPDLFDSLLLTGAFDPPPTEIAAALQTELGRFDCYTSTVDGVWGPGSRGAVDRFFAKQPGITPVSLQADVALFRQIVSLTGVECDPVPVVARPATPAPQAQSQAAAPATAPATADPAPAPRAPATALGVFR
ncbi:MAG: hypothetical protein II336_08980 [Loktanella sp.]|nr:hypothetical protein [Loktanella sp.]